MFIYNYVYIKYIYIYVEWLIGDLSDPPRFKMFASGWYATGNIQN